MIKIAICDDEELFRSEMEKFVSVYGNESDTEIEIDTYESASQMVKEIHDSFIYTHQGFIASFHHIKEVKRNAVCFGRGVEIPISRKHYEPVKAMHMDKIYRLREEKNHSQNHS